VFTSFDDKNDSSDKRIDSSDVQKNPTVPHGRVVSLCTESESLITNITLRVKYAKSLPFRHDSKCDSKHDSNDVFRTSAYMCLPH
jgi:hypothetical protein